MDADGGNPQNLLTIPIMTSTPHGLPTVNGLPSSSNRDGHVIDGIPTYAIYVIDADGESTKTH